MLETVCRLDSQNGANNGFGKVDLSNINSGYGIGPYSLKSSIHVGGRADHDKHRFFTGAIAGLQIFTEGATASEVHCMYSLQEELVLGTSSHSCSFHR